jgi:hypothetical protein
MCRQFSFFFLKSDHRCTNFTPSNCILNDNETIPLQQDKVKAASDGALISKLISPVASQNIMYCRKQAAVLGFEGYLK